MKTSTSKRKPFGVAFDHFSGAVTQFAGKPGTFFAAILLIVGWAACGPVFNYSDTWQLVINTSTTIITFLMVFVIQQTQNKDTKALHLKLNELIACNKGSSNRLVDIEDLTEAELEALKKYYVKLSELAKKETDIHCSHSIDEAAANHTTKAKAKARVH